MSQLYSYSRIGCFSTCPAQYSHRYIQKTPSPLPEGVELFMGSRFHEAMEFLYESLPKRTPSLEELLTHFDQVWEAAWKTLLFKQKQRGFATPIRISREGETIGDYHERSRLFLERYYEKYKPFEQDQTVERGIERKVLFSLDPQGLYRMQGYIDRVARTPDGTLVVHDYKTGSHKHLPGDPEKEDQLALYQVGLSQDPLFQGADFRLMWHYVAFEDDIVEAHRTPDDLEGLKKTYIHKIKTIDTAKEHPPTPSALCGWCEFMPLCQAGQEEVARRKRRKEGATVSQAPPVPSPVSLPPAPPSSEAAIETPAPRIDPVAAPPTPEPSPRGRKKTAPPSKDQLPLFG